MAVTDRKVSIQQWVELTADQRSHVLLYTVTLAYFPGILALTLPKLATISLLLRMLNPSRLHRNIMWGGGAVVTINSFICLGTLVGRCTPLRATWDLNFPPEKTKCHWGLWFQVELGIYTTIACAVVDLYRKYPCLSATKPSALRL